MARRLLIAISICLFAAALSPADSQATGFTHAALQGSYACFATGSFLFISTSAQALLNFSADGKGHVRSGAMSVQLLGEDTIGNGSSLPGPQTPWFFYQNAFENCSYTGGTGEYSINPDGTGTVTINWTAVTANSTDCNENITAHYLILMGSHTALNFITNDLPSATSTFTEALSGSCTIQVPK